MPPNIVTFAHLRSTDNRCGLRAHPARACFDRKTPDRAGRFSTPVTSHQFALAFIGAQNGWAVGDLGCILTHKTADPHGAQREGGRRAAMLAVFASATDVPLELVAQVGAAEGYIRP